MIQNILYPTDLTSHSQEGLEYAHSLAQRNRAHLIVFHALSFPSVWLYPCETEIYCDQWEQTLAEFRIDRLLTEGEIKVERFVADALKSASGEVSWKPRVTLGKAPEEIVTAALQEEVGLIVMSRRQRSWPARIFSRGVLEKVSRNAPCPVLLVDGGRGVDRRGGLRLSVLEELPSY
jgi:nucleotide-binding universal stress UspA family protein